MYKEIIEKGLSKEYIEHRSQYILESIEYLIDILKYYIHDKYNINESNIDISFQYFTPEMYCPITSENYLMFYQDPFKLDFKEVEIDITLKNIKNASISYIYLDIDEYLKSLGRDGIHYCLECGAEPKIKIECCYTDGYDKLTYIITELYKSYIIKKK